MAEIIIREEENHEAFTALYRNAGLDIGDDWLDICRPVFSAAARSGGRLLGAATVSRRFGRMVLEYLAVETEARGKGLGKKLTDRCLAFASGAGETELWIAAREPDFYRKLGAVDTEDRALLADCSRCPDYQRGCEPKELVFRLKERNL